MYHSKIGSCINTVARVNLIIGQHKQIPSLISYKDKQQPSLPHPFIALYYSIEESSLTHPVLSVDFHTVF